MKLERRVLEDGVLKFSKLGNIRSANVLGPFTVAVEAGPLTYDPLPGGKLRINGVRTAAGVVGQTFHLANFNKFTPPLVNVTNPLAHASTAIKALAFSKQTGRFALLAGAAGGNDILQELDAYNGGVTGTAYPLGRADATALIQAGTNRFIVTTATRELLRVELKPATSTTTVIPLPSTVAPVSRLARVPSVGGCISLNLLTGNGPLGPNFRSEGFLAADFNSDTHNDLAIVGVDGLDVVIHILHGDGTGKLALPDNLWVKMTLSSSRQASPLRVATGSDASCRLKARRRRSPACCWKARPAPQGISGQTLVSSVAL